MKKNNIKISVIVPVYNVEKYIEKCLESLVNQTLKYIEIIVVNDGSLDNSQEIIDRYVKKYPKKVKSFIKENGGLSDARNFGIKKATGEYLAFVDSDDFVDLEMFEKMYNRAIKTKSEIVCCSLKYYYLNKKTEKITKFSKIDKFGTSISNNPEILSIVKSYAWNKIYNREFWEENKFEFPKQWFEDSALIYNVLAKAEKIEYVNEPLYNYIKEREGAITNVINLKIYDIFKSCDNIIEFYKKEKLYDSCFNVLEDVCVGHIFSRILSLTGSKNSKISKKFIKDSIKYLNKNFKDWYKNTTKLNSSHLIISFFKRTFIKNTTFMYIYVMCLYKPVNLIKENKYYKILIRKFNSYLQKKKRSVSIHKNGYKLMEDLSEIFKDLDVLHFADFGTMLGLVRDKGIMSHDLDIDIGIIIQGKTTKTDVMEVLESAGFVLWRRYLFGDNIVEESYYYKGIKVDFNYYESDKKHSYTWLFYRDPKKKYKENRDVVKMTYSKIDKLKQIVVNNRKICIPSNAKTILKEKYGPNWTVPDKKWIYWQSPAATKIDGEGYFITYSKL